MLHHRPHAGAVLLSFLALLAVALIFRSLLVELLFVVAGLAGGTLTAALVFLYFGVRRRGGEIPEQEEPPAVEPVLPGTPWWEGAGTVSRADLRQRTECAAKLERSDLIPYDRNEADQNAEDHGQALHLGISSGPGSPGAAEGDQQT